MSASVLNNLYSSILFKLLNCLLITYMWNLVVTSISRQFVFQWVLIVPHWLQICCHIHMKLILYNILKTLHTCKLQNGLIILTFVWSLMRMVNFSQDSRTSVMTDFPIYIIYSLMSWTYFMDMIYLYPIQCQYVYIYKIHISTIREICYGKQYAYWCHS